MSAAGDPTPVSIAYTIDAANLIVDIAGPWDAYAKANGAPELTVEKVLFTPLFDYVAGPGSEEIVRLLLERVRTGHSLTLYFRCDSPSLRRFMRFEMRGLPHDRVRCESFVEREEPRPTPPLLDAAIPRGDGVVVVCGWCRKVRVAPRQWVEVEEAVEILAIFEPPELPHISHGICEACSDLLRARAEPARAAG